MGFYTTTRNGKSVTVGFTDGDVLRDVADLYSMLPAEYEGSASVEAEQLKAMLADLQGGRSLSGAAWAQLKPILARYASQLAAWRKTADGKAQGYVTTDAPEAGRILEAARLLPASVAAKLAQDGGPTGLPASSLRLAARPREDRGRFLGDSRIYDPMLLRGDSIHAEEAAQRLLAAGRVRISGQGPASEAAAADLTRRVGDKATVSAFRVAGNPYVQLRAVREAQLREAVAGSPKLWVDDTRRPPDDSWRWAQNAKAAETIIQNGDIRLVSIDFDLDQPPNYGEPAYVAANGADFCAWMRRHGYMPPKVAIEIHSANPAGIAEMLLALGLTAEQVLIDPYVPDETKPEDVMEREPPRLSEAALLREQAASYKTASTTLADKAATAPHLLDSVLHDLAHAHRHLGRLSASDVKASEESQTFNAEHIANHLESAVDHAKKLDAHLKTNASDPDAWKAERDALQSMREVRALLPARLREGKPPPPPNLRPAAPHDEATELASSTPVRECGTCKMFDCGSCWGYGGIRVDDDWLCDSYQLDPGWKAQNAVADAPEMPSLMQMMEAGRLLRRGA